MLTSATRSWSLVMLKHWAISTVVNSMFIWFNMSSRILFVEFLSRTEVVTWTLLVKANFLDFDTTNFLWTFQMTKESWTLCLLLWYFIFASLRITLNIELLVLLTIVILLHILVLGCTSHFDCFFHGLWTVKLFIEYIFLNRNIFQW